MEDTLHTTTSAGKLVGVTRQAIDKAIRTGRLKATRAHKVWVILESDLLKVYKHEDVPKDKR